MTHDEIIQALIGVAVAACHALNNGVALGDNRCVISTVDALALSFALDVLDNLPDDQPGVTMNGPGRAAWALLDVVK